MGITNSNKVADVQSVSCGGAFKVTIGLTAAPDIVTNPTDIVLVLDRSGSMTGEPLANLKLGAKAFIDIIEENTDGVKDGVIGNGSRMAIVSFATTATADTQLITSVFDLKTAVDNLIAGGSTNHGDAFTKAIQLFDPQSSNAKVIVIFTDGNTTTGVPPAPIAAAARAMGITIYCIGLVGSDGVDVNVLNDWATPPAVSHVSIAPTAAELVALFEELAANITNPGATNIVINEKLASDFAIDSLTPPAIGTATMLDSRTIRWTIPELGMTASESAALEFMVRDQTQIPGVRQINESISYSDDEGNIVIFPSPTISVECGPTVTEPCPEPVNLSVEGCADAIVVDMGDTFLESLGRIIQMDVTIRSVCPGKRVALGVILTEVDQNGTEYQRGMKTLTIPSHNSPSCRDVLVKCIKFVLPEDLDVSTEDPMAICSTRNLKARFIAHYVDTDFRCCESVVTL